MAASCRNSKGYGGPPGSGESWFEPRRGNCEARRHLRWCRASLFCSPCKRFTSIRAQVVPRALRSRSFNGLLMTPASRPRGPAGSRSGGSGRRTRPDPACDTPERTCHPASAARLDLEPPDTEREGPAATTESLSCWIIIQRSFPFRLAHPAAALRPQRRASSIITPIVALAFGAVTGMAATSVQANQPTPCWACGSASTSRPTWSGSQSSRSRCCGREPQPARQTAGELLERQPWQPETRNAGLTPSGANLRILLQPGRDRRGPGLGRGG